MRSILVPLTAIACLTPVLVHAQTRVNTEWSSISGLPINIHWTASMIASTNHVITVGNHAAPGQGANVLLTKYSTGGAIVWQVEYNSPDSLGDYGIALAEDDHGNFLVAAACERDSTATDIAVLKFNTSGQLQWDYFFDGTGGEDVPARIGTYNNEVFVCGGTEDTSGNSDFLTLSLDPFGNEQWTATYDHNQLHDAAVAMAIDPMNGDITVTGGSADQLNAYDMATVTYDQGGTQLGSVRSNYGVGIEQPTCFATDTAGNAIVGGWYTNNFNEIKLSLISLNDTLGLNWSALFDPGPGEDKIMDLAVDQAGYIYVCGHSESIADGYRAYTARYTAQGALDWQKFYLSADGGAYAKRISLDADGHVNVCGMLYEGGDTNILLLQYDTANGKQNFSQTYDAGGAEVAATIESDHWGNIYVHGTTSSNGSGYVTLKYATLHHTTTIATDTTDSFDFANDEVLLQFLPAFIDSTAVDDDGKTFGQLSDFVKPAAIDSLNSLFQGQYQWGRMPAIKIYPELKTSYTESYSRSGDTVAMPPFWAAFQVLTPSNMDELAAARLIDTSMATMIDFAEVNAIGYLASSPDDSLYVNGAQLGLESQLSPDRDIEMERAWAVHEGSSIRVAVIDVGLNWRHWDLQVSQGFSFADSKVVGGYNFVAGEPISANANNDYGGHGTAVAGIIAANRNNGDGIAGIAGGDAAQGNSGVQLFGYKVGNALVSNLKIAQALNRASRDLNTSNPEATGDAVHVINVSLQVGKRSHLLCDATKFAYENGCSVSASAGNNGANQLMFPAGCRDNWVIAVGGSDASGARHTSAIGEEWSSNSGEGLDLLAPSVKSLVASLGGSAYEYAPFWATSAAAPHVSGVAALMMGYYHHGNQWYSRILFPEDIEQMLQNEASKIDSIEYDTINGYGRLNAGQVLEAIKWPEHYLHSWSQENSFSISALVASGVTRYLARSFDGIPKGWYFMDIYQVDFNVPCDIPPSATVLDAWARNASARSSLWAYGAPVVDPVPGAEVLSFNDSIVTIRGYVYYVDSPVLGSSAIQKWVPGHHSGTHRVAYTAYVEDTVWLGAEGLSAQRTTMVRVWPNPVTGKQQLEVAGSGSVNIGLYDMRGTLLRHIYSGTIREESRWEVEWDEIAAGVYFYKVMLNGEPHALRVIKH